MVSPRLESGCEIFTTEHYAIKSIVLIDFIIFTTMSTHSSISPTRSTDL